jgi:hypothetical protein
MPWVLSVRWGEARFAEGEKCKLASPGAFTIVFIVALPLLLVFFLFSDQVASIAARSLLKYSPLLVLRFLGLIG